MDWKELVVLPQWMPLRDLPTQVRQLSEDLFKLGEGQYCIGLPNVENFIIKPGGPFISSIFWATGDGAALRAANMEIEKDENLCCSPPPEILPGEGANTYHAILEQLKLRQCVGIVQSAAYRIAKDGLFIHQTIRSEISDYYFRSRKIAKKEFPYAIRWKMNKWNSTEMG